MNFISLLEVDKQDCWFQQRWGYGACSKFDNADVERVLWWSHYFLKLVGPSIPRSITTEFLSLEVYEGECVQKQPTHIRRTETKY
jgi:hypothetical protein